ncbi:hypothetical protein [Microbacterium album]|uniref:Uncharacterized protein n=1 Tax=Microbacterium album TaxID=2053191 RepID=A0A917IG35_9MICO|nr:hypothetical protein [Microbacterium album]GGH42900.1 hypothetical protein GCM10010921_16410 [Microbacterium album]
MNPPSAPLRFRRIDVPDAWLPVPAGLDEDRAVAWVRGVVDSLRDDWADVWDDDYEAQLLVPLLGVVSERGPEAGTLFVCWPAVSPVMVLIGVSTVPTRDVPDWGAEGYEPTYCSAAGIGPGIEWRRRRTVQFRDRPLELVTRALVFANEHRSVVVDMTETTAAFAAQVALDLQPFVDSLEIEHEDGTRFRSGPPAGLLQPAEWGGES